MRVRLCAPCLAAALLLSLGAGAARAETLAVTIPTPAGSIASDPPGLACGTPFYCTADYATGSQVTLTATPVRGFAFAGFHDDCTGPSCVLTMSGVRQVRAEFVRFAVGTRSKARRIRATGTAILTIRAGAPGEMVLSGAKVRRQEVPVATASNVKLEVAARGAAARRLRRTGDVTVPVTVAFTPAGGAPARLSRPVRLHLNLGQFEI
jgi:hypothetical protein